MSIKLLDCPFQIYVQLITQLYVIFIFSDMIDQALGWNAPVRRRRQDELSQNSNKQSNQPIRQVQPRPNPRKMYSQETSAKGQESQQNSSLNASSRSRPRNQGSLQETSSRFTPAPPVFHEQIHSPQIQNKGRAQFAHSVEMRNSSRLLTTSSIRLKEEQKKKEVEKEQSMYKIKMIIFLIISFFLVIQAMTPSRKVPYKR